jgi:hypothetical protein
MPAFVRLRQMVVAHKDLLQEIEEMERKYDRRFLVVLEAIKKSMEPSEKVWKKIGFQPREKREAPPGLLKPPAPGPPFAILPPSPLFIANFLHNALYQSFFFPGRKIPLQTLLRFPQLGKALAEGTWRTW